MTQMIVPHDQLNADALRGVIEEFVSRSGTELTDVQPMIEQVLRQLRDGAVVLTYDPDSKTCNIVPKGLVS